MITRKLRPWVQTLDWRRSIRCLSPGAIILGSALNILEAGKSIPCFLSLYQTLAEPQTVSIGLLLFPPAEGQDAFSGLQTQAMSMYIMRFAV